MVRLALLSIAACAVAFGVAACRAPTQITFDVTTNVPCSALQSTSIVAGALDALTDDVPATTSAPRCTTEGHIGALVVIPSGADDDLVAVRVTTGVSVDPDQCGPHGEGCIVAKRALHFVPHSSLVVDVAMDQACEGVECDGELTCVAGQCRSAIIPDPTACESASGCGDGVLAPADGGAPVDASSDATIDASGSDAAPDAPLDAFVDGSAPDGAVAAAVLDLGLSDQFGCALLPDHTVACWGSDWAGALGDGYEDAATYAFTPVRVPGLDHVTHLAVGADSACVVFDDGGVSCWGYNGDGATGTGNSNDDLVPAKVYFDDQAVIGSLGAGVHHMCAATPDGRTIWCWGLYNPSDDGANGGSNTPAYVPAVDAGLLEMHGGYGVTCGRFDDGLVRCWGANAYDMLGQGSALNPADAESDTPLVVEGAPSATQQLCVGFSHACVLSTSHDVWCWGETDMGALGRIDAGGAPQTGVATRVPYVDPHVTQIACAFSTTCARYDDAGVQCWGYDYDDELGLPAPPNVYLDPQSIPGLGPVTTIFAGGNSQCAILTDGGVACWGNDGSYQLGAGPGVNADAGPIGVVPVTF